MKKFIALFILVALCFTAFACGKLNTPDYGSRGITTNDDENETTKPIITNNEPFVSVLGVSVISDIKSEEAVTPYEIFNTSHYYSNGNYYRGTGRESLLNITDYIFHMPHIKIQNGFKMTSPDNVTCGNVTLYTLGGYKIDDCADIDPENFGRYLTYGIEYIAKFYVTRELQSESGNETQYYICYVIVSTTDTESYAESTAATTTDNIMIK